MAHMHSWVVTSRSKSGDRIRVSYRCSTCGQTKTETEST